MVRILLQKSTENKAEKMAQITEKVDVCVIGAGHAGCEAALACARMGLETVIFTVSVESIALMPCNPNIGGSSKGHLVRELDALGGEMGKNIDHTFIQSKMLNASKGPAVHSLRAQADKAEYSRRMRQILENTGASGYQAGRSAAIFYGMMWMQTRFPEKLVQRKKSVVCGHLRERYTKPKRLFCVPEPT